MTRALLAAVTILGSWLLIDLLLHEYVLAGYYLQNPALWRSPEQLSVTLVFAVRFVLIAIFVGIYAQLVRPKSLAAGLWLGACLGLALGVAAGFGSFIHMPVPIALAWGWFAGGWLKGIVAGGIMGGLMREVPPTGI